MDDIVITSSILEIKIEKDADDQDIFVVSRKHSGKAGTFNVDGSEGGVYSSWEVVLEKIKDLNLPSRLLNGVKQRLDTVGFAVVNLSSLDLGTED